MGRWPNKYVIGLTGNIAMGKSTVRKMLEHLGAYTIDADGLAHQVMAPGAPAYQSVIETFGKWILDKEGRVDRAKLGAVVFSHPEALTRLEGLTHPIVGQGIDTLIMRAKQGVVVVEAIKLVDGILGKQVDTVWVVDASPQIQLERLIKRGLSEPEARKRISTQNPQREKLAKANVVIANSGNPQDAWVQVEREWNRILATRGIQPTPDEVRTVQVSPQAQARVQATQPVAAPKPAPAVQQPTPQPTVQPASQPPVETIAQPTIARPPVQTTPVMDGAAVQTPRSPETVQPAPRETPSKTATQPAPVVELPLTSVDIRRGMPKNADEIARIVNLATGQNLTRVDIMTAFGEKSYLLAESRGKTLGLAGFQVENLITRMDEFIIPPDVPLAAVAEALIQAVEHASKELQSEVGFMFLPLSAPTPLVQAFTDLGYLRLEIDTIKVPAWREAAAESQPPNTQILAKKLREHLVLKPL